MDQLEELHVKSENKSIWTTTSRRPQTCRMKLPQILPSPRCSQCCICLSEANTSQTNHLVEVTVQQSIYMSAETCYHLPARHFSTFHLVHNWWLTSNYLFKQLKLVYDLFPSDHTSFHCTIQGLCFSHPCLIQLIALHNCTCNLDPIWSVAGAGLQGLFTHQKNQKWSLLTQSAKSGKTPWNKCSEMVDRAACIYGHLSGL